MLAWLWLAALPSFADRGVPLSNSTHALLPNGLTLEVKDGSLWIAHQGVLAAVPPPEDLPGWKSPLKRLAQITATDDKRMITARYADECGSEGEIRLSLNSLWARSEDALGREALARKEYPAAAALFARAAQTDESLDEAAVDSARALALSGKTQEALDALDGLISREPAKTYLRCLAEPDLAPLLNGPRLVNLRTPTPGAAQLKLESVLKGSVEFSPGKYAAYERVRRLVAGVARAADPPGPEEVGGRFHWHASFVVVGVKTGETLLRLPLVLAGETAGGETALHPKPVLASKAKDVAARVALANRALADLGLSLPEQIKGSLSVDKETPSGIMPFSFAGTTLRLTAFSSGSVELQDVAGVRDPAKLAGPENIAWAVWLPSASLAVFEWGQYPSEGCPKNLFDGISVLRP